MSAPRRRRPDRAKPGAWGTTEQLPSGRWRAFYRKEGVKFSAPRTFATKDEALNWLAAERADRARGSWRDPRDGQVTLREYSDTWMDSRPELSTRTREAYRYTLSSWILPRIAPAGSRGIELGELFIADLTPAVIRQWHAAAWQSSRAQAAERAARRSAPGTHPARAWATLRGLEVAPTGRLSPALLRAWQEAGEPHPELPPREPSETAGLAPVAAGYRLLRAILNTAVGDGLLTANPCQISGAGTVNYRERSTASPQEVAELAALMPRSLSAAVTLAAWSGLRSGELFGLARRHVDLDAGTVRVERALLELVGEPITFGPTKTAKSRRLVHLPGFVVDELRRHLAEHVDADPEALLFTTSTGSPIRRSYVARFFARARRAIGRSELTWHDLRHTGATLAYQAGASVPEVQARLGHATMRAASIYAHAADDSDRVLAARLDAMFRPGQVPRLRAV